MTVVKCTSPLQLLDFLNAVQGLPKDRPWYFRGQARGASWGLKPSLFRLDEISDKKIFERHLVTRLRKELEDRSHVPDRLITSDDDLLALAQHYGCPTRMLDWTVSPIVAAYFAATGSLQQRSGDPLAVFATASIVRLADHLRQSEFISPRPGINVNLAAQSGFMIKLDWDHPDMWLPDYETPVVRSAMPKVNAYISTRLIRFELPANQAGKLYHELRDRGVDAVTLFPGLHGFARTAADYAWWTTKD